MYIYKKWNNNLKSNLKSIQNDTKLTKEISKVFLTKS